ncbi:MAG: hypothetical protein AAF357_18340, partial [Verrucomicrobiota bacterium]
FPEFHADLLKLRLQETAEQRVELAKVIKNSNPAKLKELEEELEGLKEELRRLRERKKLLDGELDRLKRPGSEIDFGFRTPTKPETRLKLPRFNERHEDEKGGLFAFPGMNSELFPGEWLESLDDEASDVLIEIETAAPNQVPRNWIPRLVDGEMTFLIPLVETPETRAFSKVIPAPAAIIFNRAESE